ncbi:hypothetical protein B0H66DRAFT_267732 [Apodospora peruviana]|uniref:Uncharacterized protein n=1 Tax=Apodospora peruviana TaxID=516989 RepID=A0AAE0I662_9PEZI|nr:hypothetical protein B0H66DRAFT_267732 [Apodospora peruviana]
MQCSPPVFLLSAGTLCRELAIAALGNPNMVVIITRKSSYAVAGPFRPPRHDDLLGACKCAYPKIHRSPAAAEPVLLDPVLFPATAPIQIHCPQV